MSTRVRQALQGAAGAAGGEALNVEDVFSTYLYHGTQTQVGGQTITNNIDLSTEGGMVWFKARDAASSATITDTEMGAGNYLETSNTSAKNYSSTYMTSFNTDGFTLGAFSGFTNSDLDYVSWTFRKAPKFFDVVTYTGDGNSTKVLSHNLGTTVGSVIIKDLDNNSQNWQVFHRSMSGTPNYSIMNLNTTAAVTTVGVQLWDQSNTTFTVYSNTGQNVSGRNYVAYLFAHNDGDGEFGPTGDQDIIKCGSFTVNSSGWSVDLGFEPQWVMIKKASGTSDWGVVDNMRSWDTLSGTGDNATQLRANLSNAENRETYPRITSTGFNHEGAAGWLSSGAEYIYIAIRRGPMAVPESATDVFGVKDRYSEGSLPTWQSGFVTDMAMRKRTSGSDSYIYTRLTQGKELAANATSIEATTGNSSFDYMTGWGDIASTSSGDFGWNWRRAPNFFDVVAYTGNGNSGRNINHNLGVAPEMMWIKCRSNTDNWNVYHKDIDVHSDNAPETDVIYLNRNNAASEAGINTFQNTAPTDSVFTVGQASHVNGSGRTYIAYLFATLNGVSKVGGYTGNGTNQTIDCGFTNGARFVLLRRTDFFGDWTVYDSERGIVAGNDPYLSLNSTNAEDVYGATDTIDPQSSGFIVNQVSTNNLNVNNASYIFYAIA
jgi:hypothetical protein